jgi:hypothetical protein
VKFFKFDAQNNPALDSGKVDIDRQKIGESKNTSVKTISEKWPYFSGKTSIRTPVACENPRNQPCYVLEKVILTRKTPENRTLSSTRNENAGNKMATQAWPWPM